MKAEGCLSDAYPDTLLASQLCDRPTSLQRYFTARKRLLEQAASKQADNRVKIELDRLINMDERSRIVYSKRRHISENILNCCCPRCGQVFLDFSDCFAVKCSRCPCAFCAWCLADCGDDAHEHVKQCPFKTNADDYFGSTDEFDAAQRRRRIRDIRTYLSKLEKDIAKDVLLAIRSDLQALDLDQEFYGDKKINKGETKNDDEPEQVRKGKFKYKVTNRVSPNGHNVREKPSLDAKIARCIQRGDECDVILVQGEWLKIKNNEWVLCTFKNVIYLELMKGDRLGRRSENNDISIELDSDHVGLAIAEKRLIRLKDQNNCKVGQDVVWKRGQEKHNRQVVEGSKDNGNEGTFVATKIKEKNVNGWGKDTAGK